MTAMDVLTLDLNSIDIGSGVVAEQAWILEGPIVLIGTVAGASGHHLKSRFDVQKGMFIDPLPGVRLQSGLTELASVVMAAAQ
ncbi:MAG: hypothetical protein IPG93_25740 [Burkholderiales bacterium]|nr:hypothetical protein [Burkholderiales bacterium]